MNPVAPDGSSPRIFPASNTRPADFPDSLPFIPGVQAVVNVAADGSANSCVWMIGGQDEEAFHAYQREGHAIGAAAEQAGLEVPVTDGKPDMATLQAAAERMPSSLLERTMSFLRSASESRGASDASELLDRVVQACVADGWEEEEQEQLFPFTARNARVRRGGRTRHLTALGYPGAGGQVGMFEGND
jgi:hypothetical protein